MEEKNTQQNKSEIALREEKVLEFWRENKIFEKSLAKDSPKGNYVFYDGPPFATGLMHHGHILGSTVKDAIGRYQTMLGYHVPRKWGWDCHGLPIENIVEKDLKVSGHKEIEALGIDVFTEYARSKVLTYVHDWKKSVERIGRWVDFDGGYKTMDNTFIESVWWAFSELNKKGLVYEGVRVLAYCARCETPIANSEIAMDNSYKDIADISVFVKFELEGEPKTYLLAWTTTPWTLPGNTAIAVNKDIHYIKVKIGDEFLIVAKETASKVFKDKTYFGVEEFKGEKLIGKKYKPVFDYYKNVDMPNKENIWKVWHADFVTVEKGTGIAHEAPAFGEEDFDLSKANNIPIIVHVDIQGRFKPEVTDFAGMKVKPKDTAEDKDAHLRGDIEVIKYLQTTGAYFDKEKIIHSYPHCMRCDTPIIYYALPSWFINVTKVKDKIISRAKSITWIPEHLKEGRFKHILEGAPDWNVSRNRYWASPLPVWKCAECKNQTFISSLADLKEKVKKSGNKYFVMRHGQSESNIKSNMHGVVSSRPDSIDHLTKKGKEEVNETAKKLKDQKIDLIFVSPFMRTQETLDILKDSLGFKDEQIVVDKRLGELNAGDFDGKPWDEYREMFKNERQRFLDPIHGGESVLDVKKRVGDLMYELETKYQNKNILIISHGSPLWMAFAVLAGYDVDQSIAMTGGVFRRTEGLEQGFTSDFRHFSNAEYRVLDFVSIPHNKDYELDYHRPYIDNIKLTCAHSNSSVQACGGEMTRVLEVLDCWLESGSMPFAQDHYPFENPNWHKNNFPAGFVAEYIAQTRTWFYYTHVISTILFGEAPFKHVVTTGNLLAEDGYKLSKSRGNFTDPQILFDKFGVDAERLYLMMSPLMKGEDANFLERSIAEVASKIVSRLDNVVTFYELYRDKNLESNSRPKSKNVLDKWILARLDQITTEITNGMNAYDMPMASRPIDRFVEDLSTWYLRRSRERIKDGEAEAKSTLYFVLKTLAKLMAPFAPFTAEDIWLRLKIAKDEESVHLSKWPEAKKASIFSFNKPKTLKNMQITREIVSLGLKDRQKSNLPVRQPLARLQIKNYGLGGEYTELIKDELNVKDVKENKLLDSEIELDKNITPELKAEGEYREFMRELQDERKKLGLNPGDKMAMSIETLYKKYKIMPSLQDHMLRVAAVASMICDNFTESINKEEIITACLLHDMGNIIKSDFKVFPDFFQPEGFEYWEKVKQEYVEKYGTEEHVVHNKIAHEVGVKERIIELMDAINFLHASSLARENDFGRKIIQYCDDRVMPLGVVSLEERLADLRKRYGYKGGKESDRGVFDNALRQIEKQIFAKCKIKPEDINDRTVAPIIAELKNFVIK